MHASKRERGIEPSIFHGQNLRGAGNGVGGGGRLKVRLGEVLDSALDLVVVAVAAVEEESVSGGAEVQGSGEARGKDDENGRGGEAHFGKVG